MYSILKNILVIYLYLVCIKTTFIFLENLFPNFIKLHRITPTRKPLYETIILYTLLRHLTLTQ